MYITNNEVVLESKAIRVDKSVCVDRMVVILYYIILFHVCCLQCIIFVLLAHF